MSEVGVTKADVVLRCPATSMTWNVLGRSVAKPKNDVFGEGAEKVLRPNEDRFRFEVSDSRLLAAVSDGAGSSGLCCGQWAQAIVDNLPGSPFGSCDALNQWMGGFWKEFADDAKRQLIAFPARHTKLIREGSCATLTACWMRKSVDGVKMRWMGYGDSALYVFERHGSDFVLTSCHPATVSQFDNAPFLLNWKDVPRNAHLRTGEVLLSSDATVVIASDGVAQFLILRYLSGLHAAADCANHGDISSKLMAEFRHMMAGSGSKMADAARRHGCQQQPDFSTVINLLRSSLDSEDAFAALVKGWNEDGLLVNDDATVIMIDVSTDIVAVNCGCDAPSDATEQLNSDVLSSKE